ncbi:MAG TPA: DUF2071 domain-containing protein [Verrucomicrobiae bacterium]|jgi:hypothetical protein|nr:DUF2071 domain-containing protein [Verrucomicrobiae bacterium]
MNRLLDLRCHPFPVVARFERVVAVSFAFPETTLRCFVPEGLEIDTYEGLGFLTVAMVWTKKLRPAGFPEFLGQDFLLAGYRVFTRLREESGRRLRGLKIIRSETDKKRMVWAGNLLTAYNYRHVNVRLTESGSETTLETSLPDGTRTAAFTFGRPGEEIPLPPGSPFPDWHTARLFAGPMPFTFSPRSDGRFVVIDGSREDWTPRPIPVTKWEVGLFQEETFRGTKPVLANAFSVEGVNYRWEKGRIVSPERAA